MTLLIQLRDNTSCAKKRLAGNSIQAIKTSLANEKTGKESQGKNILSPITFAFPSIASFQPFKTVIPLIHQLKISTKIHTT